MPPDASGLRFDATYHRYWTGPRELLAVTHVLQTATHAEFLRLVGVAT